MKPNAKSFSNLLQEVVTHEDRLLLLDELQELADSGFKASATAFDTALQTVRPRVAAAIVADLKEAAGDKTEWLKAAKIFFAEAPSVEVTMAVEMRPAALQRIVERIRELSGKPLMMSLLVNPALLGGVLMVSGGVFKDYSLSARLNDLFREMYGE